jgi:cation:H+ antiporter
MLEILLWTLVFIVSIFVLVKSADYFTDSAEKIGLYLGLPVFIVGVTIVALGTSLPELVSSIIAVVRGYSDIVVGNVVGSNITNVFLVLGVAAIIGKHLRVSYELIHVDLPLLLGSTFLLGLYVWDGIFNIWEAILSLVLLVIYILYAIHSSERHKGKTKKLRKEVKKALKEERIRKKLEIKDLIILVVSAFFIFISAKYVIESVIKLAEIFSIASGIIAASAVALGTSLPELFVSATAARKGKTGIAIGNILGSNIFNALGVMGIPALFGTLFVPSFIFESALPIMLLSILLVSTLLYFFVTQDREVTLWEGWMLLIFYVVYLGKLFGVF